MICLETQLWQNDWNMHEKPGVKADVWAEIQLNVLTSARSCVWILTKPTGHQVKPSLTSNY
jgi:hypothetical protein